MNPQGAWKEDTAGGCRNTSLQCGTFRLPVLKYFGWQASSLSMLGRGPVQCFFFEGFILLVVFKGKPREKPMPVWGVQRQQRQKTLDCLAHPFTHPSTGLWRICASPNIWPPSSLRERRLRPRLQSWKRCERHIPGLAPEAFVSCIFVRARPVFTDNTSLI